MKRVISVGKYGNTVEKEDYEDKLHNKLIYEMFEEVLKTLPDEDLNGEIIQYWKNAGLIVKYLEDMIYLEDIKEGEVTNSVVCIIPEKISESQMSYYEENYLNSLDTFIGVNYSNDEFKLLDGKTLSSSGLYDFFKEKNQKIRK